MKQQAIKHADVIPLLRAQARAKFLWGMLAGIGLAGAALFAGLTWAVIWYV